MQKTKSRKLLAIFLALLLSLSLVPFTVVVATEAPAAAQTPLEFVEKLTPRLDGADFEVDWYSAVYVANPYDVMGMNMATGEPMSLGIQQKVNVYVPENATEKSPIILLLNNGGWITNNYPTDTIVNYTDKGPANGDYSSTGIDDRIGAALNAGYIIVSYGARSRGQQEAITNNYIGHSPATVADTKAVITYLRWSAEEGSVTVGNTDLIIVTGTSGGGALSTLICATGNSSDFYEELYTIGAAGVSKGSDGSYRSEYGDNVFATIAYCPIIELPDADAAYEWTYYETRLAYAENDETDMPLGEPPFDLDLIYGPDTLELSKAYVNSFIDYFDALGLVDESGKPLSAANDTFKNAIIKLLEKGAEKAVAELAEGSVLPNPMGEYDWLKIDNGKATIDWDSYLYWVGLQTALKYVPAFGNIGTPNEHPSRKENDLLGTADQRYNHWGAWQWENDVGGVDGVGSSETGLTWEKYLAESPDAALILKQIKMLNAIPYLLGDEGESAPYWYVRHGMADRDTSFAIEATLYYALLNDSSVKDVNFNFAWLKPHSGNYDVPEAYAWLAEVLAGEGYVPPASSAKSNPFTDIKESDWFYKDVLAAYASGLITGTTATLFSPNDNMTYAQAVTLAARMHQFNADGKITLVNSEGSAWYNSYVDYAKENGIISDDLDWGAMATRAGYMEIFANALPEDALAAINEVDDGAVPDVPMDHPNAEAIYKLYRAGIVRGVDDNFNCSPDSNIRRNEVATVLARILSNDARVTFSIAG